MNKNTKKIVIIAMLVAFDVIFSRLLAFNILIATVGLGFAAAAVCAMLYGPAWAGVCAALADFVGALLFPTGAYFPGFTATVRADQGIRSTIEYVLSHPECQVEDPEFDDWCDRVIEALEEAKRKIRR